MKPEPISLEITAPKQSLGIYTSRIREEFIHAMEHEELYGHDLRVILRTACIYLTVTV